MRGAEHLRPDRLPAGYRRLVLERFAPRLDVDTTPDHVRSVFRHNGELRADIVALLSGLFASPGSPTGNDDTIAVDVGARLARLGITSEDLLLAATACKRVVLEIVEGFDDLDGGPAGLLRAAVAVESWFGAMTPKVQESHRAIELELRRLNTERRRDFIRRLLTGSLAEFELRDGMVEHGLTRDARYRAIRTRVPQSTDVTALERRLGVVTRDGRANGMMSLYQGTLVIGFLAGAPNVLPGEWPVGVSQAVAINDLAPAFRSATRAFETALRARRHGVVSMEDLGMEATIVSDFEVTERLTERYIRPFERRGPSGAVVLETVRRYLAHDRDASTASRTLFVHVNTIRYRLAQFEALTHSSLRHPQTLVEVWWALEVRRLNDDVTPPRATDVARDNRLRRDSSHPPLPDLRGTSESGSGGPASTSR